MKNEEIALMLKHTWGLCNALYDHTNPINRALAAKLAELADAIRWANQSNVELDLEISIKSLYKCFGKDFIELLNAEVDKSSNELTKLKNAIATI